LNAVRIPITKPFFGEEEKRAIVKPLETGWVVQGPYVKEFESSVARFTGAEYARATSSCTTALHLALIACGIKPGDEVILPSFTFVASANAVEYMGAKPVFTDIDLAGFNIDASRIPGVLTERTKAIVPVHLFGLCADMDPILEIARRNDLAVIEDSACAIGAFYKGPHAGSMGNAGCLSFHPRKSITTGEGGMVLTNDEALARSVEIMRDHGGEMSDADRHADGVPLLPAYNTLGFNYRMTDFQGAVGVEQMKKLDHILRRKRELASRYDERLRDVSWLVTPSVPDGYEHGYQAYVCLYAPEPIGPDHGREALERMHRERNEIMAELGAAGISTRQGTHAVHNLDYYKKKYGLKEDACPNSLAAELLTLALPLYPGMTDKDQDAVIDSIRRR
jgi:dTDP-4-amino-4,6-dideoxygalactose transaminase